MYTPQLGSLAKIPASRLGKGVVAATANGQDGLTPTTVFPPAFTVVLGGIPPALAHRLLATSANSPTSARVFSQPAATLPANPSAAAVIAAPPMPQETGTLFPSLMTMVDEDPAAHVGATMEAVNTVATTSVVGVESTGRHTLVNLKWGPFRV